jgi:hypothetical protein
MWHREKREHLVIAAGSNSARMTQAMEDVCFQNKSSLQEVLGARNQYDCQETNASDLRLPVAGFL